MTITACTIADDRITNSHSMHAAHEMQDEQYSMTTTLRSIVNDQILQQLYLESDDTVSAGGMSSSAQDGHADSHSAPGT